MFAIEKQDMQIEAVKPTISPIQRFWMVLRPDRREITNVYIYSIFKGLVNLSLPLGIQAIVNFIQIGSVSASWLVLVFFVVLGLGTTGVLRIFQMRITENLQQKIYSRAAFDFAYRIPRIRMEALYRHYAPELMNRFFDTISLQKGLAKVLIDFSSASLYVVFGLLLLSLYHPFFILYSLVLLVMVYIIYRLTARRGMKTSLAESKHKYQMAHWLEELARASATFKLAGHTDLPLRRTDTHLGAYLHARESHFKVLVNQYGLMVIFQVLIATGLLAVGGMLVMNQKMNIGQFVAAEIIILSVLASVERLVLSLETFYDILTALEKIGQVTDLELEPDGGSPLPLDASLPGVEIDLNDVSFTYPGHTRQNLVDVNLQIDRRQRILICGPNGSGKSTLLNIIAGVYAVNSGSVSYNGLPKGNLNLSSLRSNVGDCLSQEELFQGTLFENIAMGKEKVTETDVRWALSKVGLADFVKSSEKGLNTLLDPQGKRLPRSIVQRLLVARSIAHRPAIILLEDTFEHLDQSSRERIIDFLTSEERSWTLVAVSNDRYLASRCDQIVEMKNGAVIGSSSFQDATHLFN